MAADAGEPDVEPVLLAAASESKSPALRAAAMQWIGRAGSAAGVPVLEALLGDASMRTGAAMALQAMIGRGIASELLGRQNVSAIPLHQLDENDFACADLYGRLANARGYGRWDRGDSRVKRGVSRFPESYADDPRVCCRIGRAKVQA